MSFKVQVGPPQISIQGQTVLVSEPDGIAWPSDRGLYLLEEPVRQRRALGAQRAVVVEDLRQWLCAIG
jgi:hypothetical protein